MAESKKKNTSKNERELTVSVKRPSRGGSSGKKASASSSKRPASSPASARKGGDKPRYEHLDEIAGIIFIALGVLFGILTYVNTGALMQSVVKFFFGLIGVVQYAMPVVLAAMGVLLIAVPKRQFGSGAVAMILGIVWSVSCVIHIAAFKLGSMSFKEYLVHAYTEGKNGLGGGFFSAIPVYGIVKLVSVAGAIVVFVAIALVLLLLITRISIRSAGKKVIAQIDTLEDKRKARMIDVKIEKEEEERAEEKRRPRRGVRGRSGDDSPSDTDYFDGLITKDDKTGSTAELSVMPKSGRLPRGGKTEGELVVGPVHKLEPEFESEVEPIAYDPLNDSIEIVLEDNITGETAESVARERKAAAEAPAVKPAEEKKPADTVKKADDAEPAPEDKEEEAVAAEPAPVPVYKTPPLTLLRQPDRSEAIANDSPSEKAKLLIETLASFNISAKVINISVGPVITRFEIQPAQGVRVNRITTLSNDIALALAAPRVRIEAPIPGKAAIGIEIPNKATAMVRLREVLDTREFTSASSPLTFALGKDIAGKPVTADLEKMPHMLIAGATGSGKSVCINSIILSTIYKSTPDEVRMILIDPKVVELSIFAPVPHLYCPVVTDPKKAAGVLKWACNEMDQRYIKMSKINARDLARFNTLQDDPANRMPRLMIIIDELADLMMVSAKDVEESIARLAQLGRACGIHLIVATQRPSVDVITGLIKTNIPSRIAFAVSSATDSRVILDGGGAEKLLGHGDMLFHANGAAKPIRAQGAFVSDEEVEGIMQFFIDNQISAPQDDRVLNAIPDLTAPTGQGNGKQEDELLPDAVRIVMDSGSASISMLQRRLRVGYARAARLVDIMEKMKLVSGFDGSKPRKVLIDEAGYAELFGAGAGMDIGSDLEDFEK